jgi:hypothetical protein
MIQSFLWLPLKGIAGWIEEAGICLHLTVRKSCAWLLHPKSRNQWKGMTRPATTSYIYFLANTVYLKIGRMKLYFVLLMKSHLQSYPCPLQINSFWNLGFLLGITIILQIITGIFLGLHYTSDLNSAYSSLFFFIREIYYGWCLRYLHSSGASFFFLFLFLHLGRTGILKVKDYSAKIISFSIFSLLIFSYLSLNSSIDVRNNKPPV